MKNRAKKRAHRREALRRQHPDLANCESPIERALLPRLRDALPPDARVRVQVPIGPFRADFLVELVRARLVVEADGAAYHTAPEDVEYDRRRDDYMKRSGFDVIRFTGSQIVRDAPACARAVAGRLGLIVAQPPRLGVRRKKPKKKRATWREAMADREWRRKESRAMERANPLPPSASCPPRTSIALF